MRRAYLTLAYLGLCLLVYLFNPRTYTPAAWREPAVCATVWNVEAWRPGR